MKPTKEQVEAYKSMAKQSPMSMESMIKAHLVENCPKFIESKLDGCLKYLTACAREILDSKSGEVADDVCYKICRDYSKMKPGPDAVKLLDKWLEKFRESNIKFKPKREAA